MVQGELRILDLDLAQRLGYSDVYKVRPLIERHKAALKELGLLVKLDEMAPEISATVAGISSQKVDGRKEAAFYLNKEQAIFITAKSGTPEAIRPIGAPHGPG